MTKIAFAMEQSLGNVTHYLNLRAAESAATWMRARWLPIEYRESRAPWAVSGSLDTFRALVPWMRDVDATFIHTTTIALLSPALLPRRPLVLSTDGTPNKPGMRAWYNLEQESTAAARAKRAIYSAVFRRAQGFVAWCEWTKRSLVEDYGVEERRVAVIPPGVDVASFRPGVREHRVPRILFVGGDFLRKGGDLLLEVFRERLRGRAELVLVTRAEVGEEPGITVHRGVSANSRQLEELYASSDLFVLPTRGDMFSVAGMEALAAGLPLVVTRIGGLSELVLEGETGLLVDVDAREALGDALERLVVDEALRRRMSERARADAVQRFDATTNALRLFDFVRGVA